MPIKGMTQAEIDAATAKVVAAGGKSVGANIDNRLPGETRQEANARITAAYKNQPAPELTQEGKAAGAIIKFVRTASGGIGEFKEIYPIGAPIPDARTTAYGNTYDAQGNLISGSGLKTGVTTSTAATTATSSTSTSNVNGAQELPAGFTPGAFPESLTKYFGAAPSDIMGWKITEYTNATGEKYYKLSISQKGAYGMAKSGSSEFGAPITKDESGNWTVFQGDYSTGSNIGDTTAGFKTVDGVLTYNGKPYSGTYLGASYNNGKSVVTTSDTTNSTGAPTTNVDVLKAALKGMGFSSTIIESSTAFLNGLLRDGLDYDNATEIFLNSKEYTLKNGSKITSPFYTEYGYLNEGLVVPKDANTLFNTVEGFKGVVSKYKLSSKYLTQDALKAYVKNDVTVADLAERAGTAQLRALEADPFQVDALIKQGFIASAADLADFYLDPKIGKEQLELNRQTGVFTAEALRRTKSGVITDTAQLAKFKQLTATLAAKGYTEAQISQLAGTGFENIAQDLQPTTQLAQIYEKAGGTVASNAALAIDIQGSLLAEEFQGTASERRKRLSEQNQRAFQGTSGTTTGSLRTSSTLGIL